VGLSLLVRRSLAQHAVSTIVTVVATALASGLVMAVFAIDAQTRDAFTGGDLGYDAVLGARGSELQLVLNTVYHLETSPGNIPWTLYQNVKKQRGVKWAVPYAVGDNYRGFRIVGTTPEVFEALDLEFADGVPFLENRREAVLGSFVAARTGLKVNDSLHAYHGVVFDEAAKHEGRFQIVGVLAPTNTPSDRAIWTPIESVFKMGGHVLRGTGKEYEPQPGTAIPDEHKEVSAVMIKFTEGNPLAGLRLKDRIQRGKEATLAWPIAKSISELFDKLGWVSRVLRLVAYLVVAVAVGAILASIYNTMNERRREFAILRALGARRGTVFGTIVAESATIAALGALFGFLVYALILAGAAFVIRTQTGVSLDVFAPHEVLLAAPVGMVVLGALAGIVPALKAYATDVAGNLTPAT